MGKNYVTIPMSHSWERIMLPFPRVTHGKELCYHSHESLMGKNYVTIPTSHSWERIMSFVPFIARKMPKSMHNIRPYIGKKLHH